MNRSLRLILLLFTLMAMLAHPMWSQQSANSGGGNSQGVGGLSSYSVGQVVYSYRAGSTGMSITEGVQQVYEGQAECPVILASQTEDCSGATLSQMSAEVAGGTWSAISDIGTTVSQSGLVTLGQASGSMPNTDTVLYTANGCIDTVVVTVWAQPEISAPELIGCAGSTLGMMTASVAGGTWSVISDIGTTVSQSGLVTLGTGQVGTANEDTIVYMANGCTATVLVTASLSGTYCSCEEENLKLNGQLASGTYSAVSVIESTAEILSDTTVLYTAGERITLLPGFRADAGSSFQAKIEACSAEEALVEPPLPVAGNEETGGGAGPHTEWRADTMAIGAGRSVVSRVWPNPFQGYVVLEVELSTREEVRVYVQSMQGGRIHEVVTGQNLEPGRHEFRVDGADLPEGMYLLSLQAGAFRETHRVVRIR